MNDVGIKRVGRFYYLLDLHGESLGRFPTYAAAAAALAELR